MIGLIDAKKLRFHREAHGLTQTELALRIGITQTHYSRIEKGSRGVSQETLEAILQVLGLSISDIWDTSTAGNEAKNEDGAPRKTPNIVIEHGTGKNRTRCTLPPTAESYTFLAEHIWKETDARLGAIVNLWYRADEETKDEIFSALFCVEQKKKKGRKDPSCGIGVCV